ncbi:DivIVA domain-containing protein [Pseudoflavonifractor phocaeensis]|uniref:DivIVA domain-containing protein n=1 Tax=Pseudoflavonifractor phocaeensis TaxID=1870988 RepID=UPI0019570E0C|nr:DivIVA domain-containing protein [Pseudoflavonifractor phocaeensis]MBM6869868.1 DivIVA domain-containing protein [Pseudoflavonifractor phocaeensis]
MMTPQDVSNQVFAKATFGGYNMVMVDEFLEVLTEDYTTLYKDNAALKAKIKVLVERVEEYRSTEDAMRKTLLAAQRMAEEQVAQAERQKEEILRGVEEELQTRRDALLKEIAAQEERLAAAKESTAAYLAKLKELHHRELEYLEGLSMMVPSPAPAAPAAPITPIPTAAAPAPEQTPAPEPALAAAGQTVLRMTPQPAPEAPAASAAQQQDPATKITVEVPVEDRKEGGLYAELMELNMSPAEGERHKRPTRQPIETETDDRPHWDDPDDTAPTKRIDFSNLQFGREYEVK